MSILNRIRADRTAVFAGKRGVGKSSTLNALFGFDLATDAAVECTLEPHVEIVDGPDGRVRIVDMPGIAANLKSAARFAPFYRTWLRRADVFVWITQANVRSYKQDQIFFDGFAARLRRQAQVVIAVSKFDSLFEPGAVGPEQEILQAKLSDVREQIIPFLGEHRRRAIVQPYSIVADWNIAELHSRIGTRSTAPKNRRAS